MRGQPNFWQRVLDLERRLNELEAWLGQGMGAGSYLDADLLDGFQGLLYRIAFGVFTDDTAWTLAHQATGWQNDTYGQFTFDVLTTSTVWVIATVMWTGDTTRADGFREIVFLDAVGGQQSDRLGCTAGHGMGITLASYWTGIAAATVTITNRARLFYTADTVQVTRRTMLALALPEFS